MNREHDMLRGPVWRLLVSMSLPAILVMTVMVLYNMADTYFIGRTGDAAQVAAVALAGSAYGVMQGMGALLGSGGCAAASLALGRGQGDALRAITAFCLWSAAALGVLLAAAGLLWAEPLCVLMGARGDVVGYAAQYLRVLALGAPLVLVGSVMANLARADGSMKQSMLSQLSGAAANVVLDPLLIQGLGMGVTGAAVATVLGNAAGCALILRHMLRRRDMFAFSPRAMRGRGRLCGRVVALGLPLAASTLLGSFTGALANGLLSGYGAEAVAAASVSGKAGYLISMVTMGICVGIQPAISFCCGRGARARVGELTRKTGLLALGIGVLMSAGFYAWRDGFVRAFIDDAAVMDYGVRMLLASLTTAPVCGVYQLCVSLLQAAGRAGWSTLLSVLRQGAMYLPCLYLTDRLWGLRGLMYAGPAADALALVAAVLLVAAWWRRLCKEPAE